MQVLKTPCICEGDCLQKREWGGIPVGVELVVSYPQSVWAFAGGGKRGKDVLGGHWLFLERLLNFQVFWLRGDKQEAKPSYWSGSDGTL